MPKNRNSKNILPHPTFPTKQTNFIIFLLRRQCPTFVPSAGSTALGSMRYLRVIHTINDNQNKQYNMKHYI